MSKIILEHTLTDHKDKVWTIAGHPSLPLLATGSSDRTSIIYDLNNYSIISKFSEAHRKSIRSVSWKLSEDIPCLAAGSFDANVSIWAKTDERYETEDYDEDDDEDGYGGTSSNKNWSLMALIEGHENEVKCVSWSLDGSYLATCSRDKTIWIWEADEYNEEFECVNILQDYHTQDIKFVKWCPEQYLLSGSYDKTIKIFKEISEGEDLSCVCDLKAHDDTVWAIDYEKTNNEMNHWRFVSCSSDSTVKVWYFKKRIDTETENWELQCELPRIHNGPIYSVSWSSKTGRIASVGCDGKLVVYKEEDDKSWIVDAVKPLAHGVFEMNCVTWLNSVENSNSSVEKLATSSDSGTINVWDIQ